ncbi:MBL fold metallo-hydrolase [Selenihalanaerobacter shriftii]|uniref:Metal-dependent hydrolase, beta-lactamase superfamily II n=1 Tax=Selenihalanaerobacter shriftii TaxID=142842 RepID=A0A1T4PXS4_9FIRM|nr:MBL fold metallo-hydrolase [Selenihalanaerobacter shriftii]SJZ96117.1 Metal-dependent hydrolase, beta-lactamase superfamily II [Selenihalanaerobacter shriftii]
MKRFRRSSLVVLSLVILIFLIAAGCNENVTASSTNVVVHFIDVGQADATLLQFPNDQIMLIDGGNNDDGKRVVNYIKRLGINKIDYLIGTHPHEDHIGGLDNIIYNFKIGKVYMPRVTHNTKSFEDLLLAIKDKQRKILVAKAGVKLINKENLKVKIIGPIKNDYGDLNNWSAVIQVKHGDNSFLFTGDAEAQAERDLIKKRDNLKVDLLKVGHHGSNTSTTQEFLEQVNPEYAIISVGLNNNYGHPSPFILKKLKDRKISIYRTDKQGIIIAISDGKQIKFNKSAISLKRNKKKTKVQITKVDLYKEKVVIKNKSKKIIDLSGWMLVSLRGNQQFVFPNNTVIKPGGILKVVSGRKANWTLNTIVWTKRYIWNNDGDAAALYDKNQNLIDEY